MRLLKTHPILGLANSYMVDSPQPANLSYMWNFGSLLGIVLIIQIITGVTLAMHYTPSVDLAFVSVEHIMRDVNYGWLLRYLHANGASFFFIFVYLHIGRGLYYGSYRAPRILPWSIGVIILVLMMATAFLGYVLPYGQISLWGATVITNLLSALPWIGKDLVETVWKFGEVSEIALPVIGKIQWNKIKRGRTEPYNNEQITIFINIPYVELARFIGLVDAEGTISVAKDRNYIKLVIKISLDNRDSTMLCSIRECINNIGRMHNVDATGMVSWVISQTDLQEILFPLIIHHNLFFITEPRRAQFNTAMYVMENNITEFSVLNLNNLPTTSYLPPLPINPSDYLKLPFFNPWLVGFVIGDGYFFIKSNLDAIFQIHQRTQLSLFTAIALLFECNRNFSYSGNGKYIQLSISSKADIQRVIHFFSVTCPMLTGYKYIQYTQWLVDLKNSARYRTLNF